MASNTAQVAKDKGNTAFKAGNWADAVGHYSAAIVADRTEPTYPLNRATAYLKLGKHQDAERDCSTVLSLDNKNVKAYFRRAQARVGLYQFAEAEKDLSDALTIEPLNTSIKTELATVRKLKDEAVQKKKSTKREPISVPPLASSSNATPNPSSSTTLPPKRIVRNVPIEIVEPTKPQPTPALKQSTEFLQPVQSRVLHESPANPPRPPSPTRASRRVGAGIFRADGKHTIIRSPSPPPTEPKLTSLPSSSVSENANAPISLPSPAAAFIPVPLTHFALTRAWNTLPTAEERFSLLKRLPPSSLPALFKNSLEPEFLISILQTFKSVASPTTNVDLIAYMHALSSIPRFGTVLLFLTPEEKGIVRVVWDTIDPNAESEERHAWAI